jgi:hypothetical protein
MNKNIIISHSPVPIHDVGRLARWRSYQYTRPKNCAVSLPIRIGVRHESYRPTVRASGGREMAAW